MVITLTLPRDGSSLLGENLSQAVTSLLSNTSPVFGWIRRNLRFSFPSRMFHFSYRAGRITLIWNEINFMSFGGSMRYGTEMSQLGFSSVCILSSNGWSPFFVFFKYDFEFYTVIDSKRVNTWDLWPNPYIIDKHKTCWHHRNTNPSFSLTSSMPALIVLLPSSRAFRHSAWPIYAMIVHIRNNSHSTSWKCAEWENSLLFLLRVLPASH